MKRHENQPKPSTSKTGNEATTNKKFAPIKPKRKSIGATPNIVPHEVLDKKKRYFEEEAKTPVVATTSASAAAGIENNSSTYASLENSFEQKRQRLLKKVEMAKQGYKTAQLVAMQEEEKEVPEDNDLDTTPYEEIDEDVEETESDIVIDMINRPPVNRLPSFIPLTSGQIDSFQTDDKNVALPEEEEEEYEERLI